MGAVDYLNARPLIFGLEQGGGAGRIELSQDTPAALADRMVAGELEIALLPVIELARLADVEVVPGLGIVTRGPARSVRLVSKVPIADVRSVALDPESRTSNALVQVLFAEVWHGRPEFGPGPLSLGRALDRYDAAVRIGDKALFELVPDGLEVHDLGEVWTNHTGLPFVFAVWAARAGVVDQEIHEILHRSCRDGTRFLDRIAEDYAWNGVRHPELSREYLRHGILYRLGSDEIRAMESFFTAAAALGLIGRPAPIRMCLERWSGGDEAVARQRGVL